MGRIWAGRPCHVSDMGAHARVGAGRYAGVTASVWRVPAAGDLETDLRVLRRGGRLVYPGDERAFTPPVGYLAGMLGRFERHPDAVFGTVCAVSNMAGRAYLRRHRGEIGRMLASFLSGLRRDWGSAGFMAADVLAVHWPTREGWEVLLGVLERGAYAGGRRCAAAAIASVARDGEGRAWIRGARSGWSAWPGRTGAGGCGRRWRGCWWRPARAVGPLGRTWAGRPCHVKATGSKPVPRRGLSGSGSGRRVRASRGSR
jgi:hypothetical protein